MGDPRVERVREELTARIRVTFEWKGFESTAVAKLDNAIAAGTAYSMADTGAALTTVMARVNDDYRKALEPTAAAHEKLLEEVSAWADRIVNGTLYFFSYNADAVAPEYFDRIARKFEQVRRELCVLPAPPFWLPGINGLK